MILLLLLSMSMTFLLGHPAPSDDHSEALCSTLRMLGQSLKDARLHGSMCMDSDPRTECTTASLEVLKKCLNGVEVDRDCLEEAHKTLTEVDNQACFCGGLVEYSEMLSSVESLLCSSPHHSSSMLSSSQGHVSKEQKTRQGMAITNDLIAFSAVKTDRGGWRDPWDYGLWGRVKFEKTLINEGRGWDGEEGIFTAPAAGTYHFSWTAYGRKDHYDSDLQLYLKKNNDPMVPPCFVGKDGTQTCSGSLVFRLEEGDIVYLTIHEGDQFRPTGNLITPLDEPHPGYTTFTGYRLQ